MGLLGLLLVLLLLLLLVLVLVLVLLPHRRAEGRSRGSCSGSCSRRTCLKCSKGAEAPLVCSVLVRRPAIPREAGQIAVCAGEARLPCSRRGCCRGRRRRCPCPFTPGCHSRGGTRGGPLHWEVDRGVC
jgi:hypothetical protein